MVEKRRRLEDKARRPLHKNFRIEFFGNRYYPLRTQVKEKSVKYTTYWNLFRELVGREIKGVDVLPL